MKNLFFAATLCVAFVMGSCSMLQSSTTTSSSSSTSTANDTTATVSAAQSAGSAMGKAIYSLYNEYKTTKTIDYKNANTYVQVASFIANATTLKQNYKDTSFYSAFATSLIGSSNNLVTSDNVDSVITTIVNENTSEETQTAVSSTVSNATSAVSSATSAISTLKSLFSSFSSK